MPTPKSGGAAKPTTTASGRGAATLPTNHVPNIAVSAAEIIDMHTIGDWEISEFVSASRGKLADVMFMFWGTCLGSAVTTATYLYDYLTTDKAVLPKPVFLQIVLFGMSLALAIAFTILNRKKTRTAEQLAEIIRARAKVTYVRKTE